MASILQSTHFIDSNIAKDLWEMSQGKTHPGPEADGRCHRERLTREQRLTLRDYCAVYTCRNEEIQECTLTQQTEERSHHVPLQWSSLFIHFMGMSWEWGPPRMDL